jgi:hypothetical protein
MDSFRGKGLFFTLQHAGQLVLSFYAIRHSVVATRNLLKYEDATKKLAEWSDEVQRQLDKTRTTQAAGAVAVRTIISNCLLIELMISQAAFNFLAAAALIILPIVVPNRLPTWFKLGVSPTMLAITLGARQYLKNFWAPGEEDSEGKDTGTKIPLPKMEDYNLAVQKTEDLLKCLEYLEYSWVIASFMAITQR